MSYTPTLASRGVSNDVVVLQYTIVRHMRQIVEGDEAIFIR